MSCAEDTVVHGIRTIHVCMDCGRRADTSERAASALDNAAAVLLTVSKMIYYCYHVGTATVRIHKNYFAHFKVLFMFPENVIGYRHLGASFFANGYPQQ